MGLFKRFLTADIRRKGVGKKRFSIAVSRGELSKKLVSLFSNTAILKLI